MIRVNTQNNILQEYNNNVKKEKEKKRYLPSQKAMLTAAILALASSGEAGIKLQDYLPNTSEYDAKVYELQRKGKTIYMIRESRNHWVETDKDGIPLYPDDSIPTWYYITGVLGALTLYKGLKMAYKKSKDYPYNSEEKIDKYFE